jgi:hypothetical protein
MAEFPPLNESATCNLVLLANTATDTAVLAKRRSIAGIENPADVLTKPLPHYKACVFYDPILFWKGETTVSDHVLPSAALPEGSVK